VSASPGDDRAKRTNGRFGPSADDSGPCHLRAQLRHLDVVGDVLQLAPHDVGHQRMYCVASNVDGRETHEPTLSGPIPPLMRDSAAPGPLT